MLAFDVCNEYWLQKIGILHGWLAVSIPFAADSFSGAVFKKAVLETKDHAKQKPRAEILPDRPLFSSDDDGQIDVGEWIPIRLCYIIWRCPRFPLHQRTAFLCSPVEISRMAYPISLSIPASPQCQHQHRLPSDNPIRLGASVEYLTSATSCACTLQPVVLPMLEH